MSRKQMALYVGGLLVAFLVSTVLQILDWRIAVSLWSMACLMAGMIFGYACGLRAANTDAERYRKLRGWMSSNVTEGWSEVERLGAIAALVDWDSFDASLDTLGECKVGLMFPPRETP